MVYTHKKILCFDKAFNNKFRDKASFEGLSRRTWKDLPLKIRGQNHAVGVIRFSKRSPCRCRVLTLIFYECITANL